MSQAPQTFFLGLGANLPFGTLEPAETLNAAVLKLEQVGVAILAQSSFFESAPQPKSDQPNFINTVLMGQATLNALELLSVCQSIELEFGRERHARWSARTLDIDILDYDGRIMPSDKDWHMLASSDGATTPMPELALPHPRLHQRAFVLVPLHELVPDWRHPVLNRTVSDLMKDISPLERCTVVQIGDK